MVKLLSDLEEEDLQGFPNVEFVKSETPFILHALKMSTKIMLKNGLQSDACVKWAAIS
jgi:hypothetical protein